MTRVPMVEERNSMVGVYAKDNCECQSMRSQLSGSGAKSGSVQLANSRAISNPERDRCQMKNSRQYPSQNSRQTHEEIKPRASPNSGIQSRKSYTSSGAISNQERMGKSEEQYPLRARFIGHHHWRIREQICTLSTKSLPTIKVFLNHGARGDMRMNKHRREIQEACCVW